MASFRLRFAVFASVRSENIPLFPSGTACSIRILGQKWVRSKCVALQTGSYLSQFVYFILQICKESACVSTIHLRMMKLKRD